MIRTYSMAELETISGLTRRTIGDYIAKGLLSGPSHRGRGASYPQADVDTLMVAPRLRTLMKKEFPDLRAVIRFLKEVSTHDLHNLANKSSERSFVLAVRRLRVRMALAAVLPQVTPEKIVAALDQLTPEQICNVDTGRHQLGAVIDMAELLSDQAPPNAREPQKDRTSAAQSEWNITLHDGVSAAQLSNEFIPPDSGASIQTELQATADRPNGNGNGETGTANKEQKFNPEKLEDIARRVEKLEALLAIE